NTHVPNPLYLFPQVQVFTLTRATPIIVTVVSLDILTLLMSASWVAFIVPFYKKKRTFIPKDKTYAEALSSLPLYSGTQSKTPWASIYLAGGCAFIQAAQFNMFSNSMWPYLRKLNPEAVETQYGHITALYSFGQCIMAPLFGFWSNRIEQVRIPLLAGFAFMMVGNFLYFLLDIFEPSNTVFVMMVARFIAGCGTGNMTLLRAYVATSSSRQDRTRAIAFVSGGIATGTLIGPAFQLLFTPLGSDGVPALPFLRLSIYNTPALFALLLNILGFLAIVFIFEENYDVLQGVSN
ncbi:hypothetical protein OSTOST_20855, partial [Ostertagia ostertagi]